MAYGGGHNARPRTVTLETPAQGGKQRVALLTIGQSPRPDVRASMFERPLSVMLEAGALDDLPDDEIHALTPRPGEHPLVTRLRDGREVTVAKERLIPYLQAALDRVEREGATTAVVLCTGSFPQLRASIPLVFPDRILVSVVNAVLPSGSLGVLMPHPGQLETMRAKWALPGRRFLGAAVSPYTAAGELERVGHELAAAGADVIVLDCMGFTREMKRCVADASGRPVVLANRLVGRVVEELAEPD